MNLKSLADRVVAVFTAVAPAAQLAEGVAGTASPIGAIAAVVLQVPDFITMAEQLTTDAGVKVSGPQKLAAVKAAVLGALNEINPALGADFDKAWALIGPVVSMLVTFAKFGFKF